MHAAFGERRGVVARELTKIHEEFRAAPLGELAASYPDAAPKGEIVVIIDPPEEKPASPEALDEFLRKALAEMSVKDAAAAAADALGVPRKEAYERSLALKSARE